MRSASDRYGRQSSLRRYLLLDGVRSHRYAVAKESHVRIVIEIRVHLQAFLLDSLKNKSPHVLLCVEFETFSGV